MGMMIRRVEVAANRKDGDIGTKKLEGEAIMETAKINAENTRMQVGLPAQFWQQVPGCMSLAASHHGTPMSIASATGLPLSFISDVLVDAVCRTCGSRRLRSPTLSCGWSSAPASRST